jgi:hypothetical protein
MALGRILLTPASHTDSSPLPVHITERLTSACILGQKAHYRQNVEQLMAAAEQVEAAGI